MNYLEITVWLEEHQYQALADRLVDDSNLEKVVTEILQNLYEKCVPAEERERIKEIVAQEEAMRKAEEAASHRFVFIEAKKNGVTSCRIGEGYGTPLEVAHACALHYSQAKKMSGQEFLEAAYKETEPITKEEFEERCAVDGSRSSDHHRGRFPGKQIYADSLLFKSHAVGGHHRRLPRHQPDD